MLMIFAWTSLAIAFASALIIVIDEVKHTQKMWIVNVAWPVTALYSSVSRSGVISGWAVAWPAMPCRGCLTKR